MRAPDRTRALARRLRKAMTLPEILLWEQLRSGRCQGLRFRRQHPVGRYVLDFYCSPARLAVEVDGAHHDLPGQMRVDAERDAWLFRQGVQVVRLAASDILDDQALDGALRLIASVATGGKVPDSYRTRGAETFTPPPPRTGGPKGDPDTVVGANLAGNPP
jgi:very-short-patch-repair endonuclease